MPKKAFSVANTVLVAGMTFSLSMMNSTPLTTVDDNSLLNAGYYTEANNLGINNASYNYLKTNVYYSNSKAQIESEATALFGNMREATEEELQSVSSYISKISKETGVDFWSLC